MRLIDADALINTLQDLFDKREKDARFTGDRGVTVTWNDAIYHIKTAPTIKPDRSMWFRIGETCVDESKGFISAERAVEKIRELLRKGW